MTLDAKGALLRLRQAFVTVGILSFFLNLLMLTVPAYTMQSYDRVLPGRSLDTLWVLTLLAVGALVIFALLTAIRQRIMTRMAVLIDDDLGPEVLRRSVQVSATSRSLVDAPHVGDLERLRGFVGSQQIGAFFDAPWMPLFLLVVFLIHPALGVVALAGGVVLAILALLTDLSTRRLIEDQGRRQRPLSGLVQAATRNAEVVEAMGMLTPLMRRWHEGRLAVHDVYVRAQDRTATLSAISRGVRFLIQVLVMGVGMYYAIQREITPGAMIAASIIMGRALAPLEQMTGAWKGFVNARTAYHRLNTLLRAPDAGRTTTHYPRPQGRLTAENVSFMFPQAERATLSGVSFELEPGQVLGIIGPSAAGKSTLARLLVGVWKAGAGKVRLDGIDVFSWDRDDFGRHVGYLPQDTELFNGTVKENIARMAEADDEAVIEAARKANAHDMIVALPKAYETPVGPDGHSLSGGQRQRIGLARALFGDPALLVLDEPNANLDMDGETALVQALEKARDAGTTIVLITHRAAILSITDKILMLRDGRAQLYGPRAQVLEQLQQAQQRASQRPQVNGAPQGRIEGHPDGRSGPSSPPPAPGGGGGEPPTS